MLTKSLSKTGEIARWVRAIHVQADRPEFKSPNPHSKPSLAMCLYCNRGSMRTLAASLAPGLVREPVSKETGGSWGLSGC